MQGSPHSLKGLKSQGDLRTAGPPLRICWSPGSGLGVTEHYTDTAVGQKCEKGQQYPDLFTPGWNTCENPGKRLGTRARGVLHVKVLISTCFLRRIRVNSGCCEKPDDNLCRYNTSLNIFLPTTFPVCCSFYFNYCIPNDLPFSQQDRKILKDPRSNLWAIIWFSFLAACTVPISVTLEYSSLQCR